MRLTARNDICRIDCQTQYRLLQHRPNEALQAATPVEEVHLQSAVRVLIVDDFDPWRHFIVLALAVRPEIQIVGEAKDGSTAIQSAQEHHPDLVILDIGLPDIDGLQVARQINLLSPKTKIIFLTEAYRQEIVVAALSTGACGYVLKSDAARDLLPALQAVLLGNRFISPKAAESLSSENQP